MSVREGKKDEVKKNQKGKKVDAAKNQDSVSTIAGENKSPAQNLRNARIVQLQKEKKILADIYKNDINRRKLEEEMEIEKVRHEFKMRELKRQAEMQAEVKTRQEELYKLLSETNGELIDDDEMQQGLIDTAADVIGEGEEELQTKMDRFITKDGSDDDGMSVCNQAKNITSEAMMLKQVIKMQPISLYVFEGDKDDFFAFRASFTQLEKKGVFDNDDLLSFLLSHVKGEAQRGLRGILPGSGQYEKAWEILTIRYGNKTRINNNNLDAIRKHAPVSPNNLMQLRSFIDTVSAFIESMRSANRINELHSGLLIADLLQKLPRNVVYQWNKLVARKQVEETLLEFKDYLITEEKVWEADPTCSHASALDNNARKHDNKKRDARGGNSSDRYTGVTVTHPSTNCVLHPDKGHTTVQCRSFVNKNVLERLKICKKLGLCFLCLCKGHMTKNCHTNTKCGYCGKNHHELLHAGETSTQAATNEDRKSSNTVYKTTDTASSFSAVRSHRTLLGILPVEVLGPKENIVINAFIDYGSNTTMINLDLAKKIGLLPAEVSIESIEIVGVHGVGIRKAACIKTVQLRAINDKQGQELKATTVLAVDGFSGPSQQLNWESVEKIFPEVHKYGLTNVTAEPAQMIIGTDNMHLILYDHFIRPVRGDNPVLVGTTLGYVLLGQLPAEKTQAVVYRNEVKMDIKLSRQVEDYFLMENLGVDSHKTSKLLSLEDQRALKIIASGTRRIEDEKAFISAMPWKCESPHLPDNRETAVQRLHSLEKKLSKQPALYIKYREAISDDIRKGYIRELTEEEDKVPSPVKWFLPHWNVVHKKKADKFRRVYDCSAKFKGESLNQQLHKGPNLLTDLFNILLRFREHAIALAADISEMYNQVRIPEEDQPCLQFLWRDDVTMPIKTYRFCRMLFGDVSAPARAVYVLQCVARDGMLTRPTGAKAILDSMYLDDLMASCDSLQTAVVIQHEARSLLEDAGFQLKKWISNVPEVLQNIAPSDLAPTEDFAPMQKGSVTANHVLGLVWKVGGDYFGYESMNLKAGKTKREILSQLTSLWDPLGFLAPFVVRAKLIVQELWKLSSGWDEEVPNGLFHVWEQWLDEAEKLSEVKIPRALTSRLDSPFERSLQVFCDASELAYGVVIYLRNVYSDGTVEVRFVAAKTRVAPQRPTLTIPRLELNAAVLAARLALKVEATLTSSINMVDLWSDSTIILAWLAQKITIETKYVVNRVTDIVENLRRLRCADNVTWRHVGTKENPSDDCTRGLPLQDMLPEAKSRYWSGPDFLMQKRNTWPLGTNAVASTADSLETWAVVQLDDKNLFALDRHSSYLRIQRIAAFVLRFVHNCKTQQSEAKRCGHLQVSEYQEAEKLLLIEAQRANIRSLYDRLRNGRSSKNLWLKRLQPTEQDELIVVGGRLGKAQQLPYTLRHPIILDGTSRLALLIVQDFHQRYGHAGPQFIKNAVLAKYWITRLSWLVKKVRSQCVSCRKFNGKTFSPMMAELPRVRIEPAMPFVKCGVDYFGPLQVKRGRSNEKVWGVIFTCLATRAVHLELADSLTADCFINVFRRFVGRRGEVEEMWSDNGTNFVGGERELRNELKKLKKSGIEDQLAARQVSWHFNPPSASHFGGAWERLIRSVRKSLHFVMKDRSATYSVLETALVEVEALLNSRPITRVSEDATDTSALTPGHFLILRPLIARSCAVVSDKEVNARSAWKKAQALVNLFWKRWLREYVPNLREFPKWTDKGPNIQEGDIVLLIESNSVRGQWPTGRVEKLFPGTDGVVRVVDVKVNGTILRRPIAKLSYVCGPNECMSW